LRISYQEAATFTFHAVRNTAKKLRMYFRNASVSRSLSNSHESHVTCNCYHYSAS